MTDIDIYQPAGISQYQAGTVMTPDAAKALDEQVRLCTEAVLREGTDYGIIPGTNGEKTLWRPGAQKLLQWFRLECICERVEVERDDDGRKHGITYRAEVGRGLKTATPVILATCEGTADYDESKFHQTEEQVKARLRELEHKWAAKDRRPPNADRWNSAKEYRADWNALMKRAQKRAIVGAVNDATAAGGIFSEREEDDDPVTEDGNTWYEQALEAALTFTDRAAGDEIYVGAAHAYRDGLCSGRQKDHIQNRVRQRQERLRNARPVEVEDLARQAARTHDSGEPPQDGPPPEDQPGTASKNQLTKLHAILTGLGFGGDDREQKLTVAEVITGRELTGPRQGRSSANLSMAEARKLTDTLDGFGSRDELIAYMAEHEQAGNDDG